jgi:hypothetical protein
MLRISGPNTMEIREGWRNFGITCPVDFIQIIFTAVCTVRVSHYSSFIQFKCYVSQCFIRQRVSFCSPHTFLFLFTTHSLRQQIKQLQKYKQHISRIFNAVNRRYLMNMVTIIYAYNKCNLASITLILFCGLLKEVVSIQTI